MGVWYTTRERVKSSLDIATTARLNTQVDQVIDAASRSVESQLQRRFYPWTGTRYFPWPNYQYARPWRLWLGADELINITSMTASGTTISSGSYYLEPVNTGPPYNRIEMRLDTSATFGQASTYQRAVAVTGVWGYDLSENVAGTLSANVTTTSATTVTVSDSSAVGVGSVLHIGTERLTVTERSMVTTAQTLQTPMTASASNVAVAVTDGTLYAVGEQLLLDSERMLIVDISGNTLTVKRAYDGTVLATHTGSTIYAPRQLTVSRGALGTTATTHASGDAITTMAVPSLVEELTIAEALTMLMQRHSGYARVLGAGDGGGRVEKRDLDDLREMALNAYGRKARTAAV